MRRLITVMIALLAMAFSAHAQDEFNVNTNPVNTNPVPATCDPPYNAAMEKLNEQEAQAQGELRKDVVDCQGQYRNNDTACIDAANKKYWVVHLEVLKGQIDADANRQICDNRVHLAAAAAFNAKNKPDPCQDQFDQTMNGLSDQDILAQAQIKKDNLDCQNRSDSTACLDANTQKNAPIHRKIINGETDASTNRTICEDRKALAQSGTQAPAKPAAPGASGVSGQPQTGTELSGNPASPGAPTGGTESSANSAPPNAPNSGGGGSSGSPGSPGNPLKGYASAGGPGATGGGSNSTGSNGGGPIGRPGNAGRPGSPGNPLKGYASEGGGSSYASKDGESGTAGAGASGINGDIPGRMMALAAKMDAAATQLQNNAMAASNEFLKGMADAMSRTAKVYAQKPGTVLPQMIDGIVKYLNADHNKNDQAYYDAAVKGVEEFQKNPARFLGEHALDAAMMGAGVAGEAATGAHSAASAAEIGTAAEAAQTAGKLEKAGGTLQGVVNDADKFSTFSPVGNGPDFTKHLPSIGPGKAPPVNPFRGKYNCFSVSMAAAKRLKTGKPHIALDTNPHEPFSMFNPTKNKWEYGDVPTSSPKYVGVLKRNFGNGKATDPLHGPDGLIAHQEGIPVSSSQQKIELSLLNEPNGSQGLVFVDGGPNSVGHIFNVQKIDGKVEFWDYQADTPIQYRMFGNGNLIYSQGGRISSTTVDWTRTFFYRLE